MSHLAPLIQDLAIILITAAITSLLFKKLKQPLILGYMVAGLLVGPHIHLFPTVTETQSITVWAEMGMIFMLFALGIEFSFRKLTHLGPTVLISGVFELSAMCLMGFLVGQLLGWNGLQSFYLGAMFSISSTTIIYKAFDEYRLKGKRFAQLVFGILIVEDLMAVLLIVLLTTIGLSRQFHGSELMWTAGKLVFYLALWLIVGLFAIPIILRSVKKHLSDETMLIVAVALCLVMVVAANQVGFSSALGAFIMGSILGETEEKEKIEKIFQPVRDLFSAIFFVSVGMLINPDALVEHAGTILLFTLIIIAGKIYYNVIGGLIAGQSIQTAIPTGISLAQIGEFSFIIANLGMTLKVTDESLYSIIVAVSAVTAFTTPYLVKSRDRLSKSIEKMIPVRVQTFLGRYLQFSYIVRAHPEWQLLIRTYAIKIVSNSVLIVAIFLLCARFLYPTLQTRFESISLAQISTLLTALILASPFLWGMIFSHSHDPTVRALIWNQLTDRSRRMMFLLRVALAQVLLAVLLAQYVSVQLVALSAFLIFTGIAISLFKFLGPIYGWLEKRLLKQIDEKAPQNPPPPAALAPWDAHLSEYEIHPQAECVGKTLASLKLRENFGIIIAMIQRGDRHIPAPGRDELLMPYDRVSVIGTDDQLAEFENFLTTFYEPIVSDELSTGSFILEQYTVSETSPFLGRTIRDSGIREKTAGLVVGIERAGRRILNPDSHFLIERGDLLWIVGNGQKLRMLSK
jgi:monovalent cation:H+ antiporter-2, CPA2 family